MRNEKMRTELSPTQNLTVGCLSGAVESTVNMPVKTYKFCAQEGRALPKSVSGWFRGVGVQAGEFSRHILRSVMALNSHLL